MIRQFLAGQKTLAYRMRRILPLGSWREQWKFDDSVKYLPVGKATLLVNCWSLPSEIDDHLMAPCVFRIDQIDLNL